MSVNASNEEPTGHAAAAAEPPLPRRSPEAAARRSALMAAAAAAGHERAAADRVAAARRARVAAAAGLPAVLIAATGVALLPGTANAANSTAATTACPAGQSPSPAAAAATGAKPATAPAAKPAKAATAPTTLPTSAAKAVVPVPKPAAGATPTASVPKPTSAPTSAAPKPSSSPTTGAPTSSSSPSWWDPLGWLGLAQPQSIFNPVPSSGTGVKAAAVNQLGTVKTANPAAVAALAATSTPSSDPSGSASSAPSSQPSSAPASSPSPSSAPPTSSATSAASSAPSSAPATSPTSAPAPVCVRPLVAGSPNEVLWHLDATSLTLYMLKYNGVVTINTINGPVKVLDFTADAADVGSMVTYAANPAGGKNDYVNGGQGQTVHLTHVHFHVLRQTGSLLGIPLDLSPGSPDMTLIGLTQGIALPIVPFANVHVDQYTLTADTLHIPGFDAFQDQ